MAGTLFVVATPIGNLEDLTFRAARVLREVPLVAAEDTRRSGHLLRHLGSRRRWSACTSTTRSAHGGGPAAAREGRLGGAGQRRRHAGHLRPRREARGRGGGGRISGRAHSGASAVMAALSASGVDSEWFSFAGFPPARGKARKQWFADVQSRAVHGPVVAFEAPHRIQQTLRELDVLLNDQIIVFRELTKLHESRYRGDRRRSSASSTRSPASSPLVIPRLAEPAGSDARPTRRRDSRDVWSNNRYAGPSGRQGGGNGDRPLGERGLRHRPAGADLTCRSHPDRKTVAERATQWRKRS